MYFLEQLIECIEVRREAHIRSTDEACDSPQLCASIELVQEIAREPKGNRDRCPPLHG